MVDCVLEGGRKNVLGVVIRRLIRAISPSFLVGEDFKAERKYLKKKSIHVLVEYPGTIELWYDN